MRSDGPILSSIAIHAGLGIFIPFSTATRQELPSARRPPTAPASPAPARQSDVVSGEARQATARRQAGQVRCGVEKHRPAGADGQTRAVGEGVVGGQDQRARIHARPARVGVVAREDQRPEAVLDDAVAAVPSLMSPAMLSESLLPPVVIQASLSRLTATLPSIVWPLPETTTATGLLPLSSVNWPPPGAVLVIVVILFASKVRWLTLGAAESRSTVPLVACEPPSTIAAPLPGKPVPPVQLPDAVQAALPALPLQVHGRIVLDRQLRRRSPERRRTCRQIAGPFVRRFHCRA